MARDEALQDIIARLRQENATLATELARLTRRPRSTKDIREIDRIQHRLAMNNDVIQECEAQLAGGGA